jgi:hypothetical protein
MRILVIVFGVLIVLAGIVWSLQGIGLILGSFMSNNPTWIWAGAGTAVLGAALAVFGFVSGPRTTDRTKPAARPPTT